MGSPKKAAKNQVFRTSDAILVMVLVGLVGSISGAILAETLHDDRPTKAQQSAETLARQLGLQYASHAAKPRLDRSPASADTSASALSGSGRIGKDPWGQPFHYFVQSNRVIVWSEGANQKSETSVGDLEAQSTAIGPKVGGDDIGSIVQL